MSPMKPPRSPRDDGFEKTLSSAQVCRRLKITRTALHRLLAAQELDFVEIRGRIRIPVDDLRRYEQERV
jgi:excisionase family DNA binding protein